MNTTERIFVEPAETRMVFENLSWGTYESLADQRSGSVPRMTYDNGLLEMMSPKRQHEHIGRLIGRMIETYSEVKDIEIISVASVTVKRSTLQKGYEADESYYITHASELSQKTELDFEFDPPPDLVVEIEITSSAIDKMKLFAAMKVLEVWRHDGNSLVMLRLVDGSYQSIDCSNELPGLTACQVNRFLLLRETISETKLIQRYRSEVLSEEVGP